MEMLAGDSSGSAVAHDSDHMRNRGGMSWELDSTMFWMVLDDVSGSISS